MATLKTLLTFTLLGAFLGLAGASWLGPKWLEWDNTPRFQTAQTLCNLPEIIRDVSAQLLYYQLVGTLTGAGLFLMLGVVFVVQRSKRRKEHEQSRQPPPPPTPPQPHPGA
jgi:hypothetical protein